MNRAASRALIPARVVGRSRKAATALSIVELKSVGAGAGISALGGVGGGIGNVFGNFVAGVARNPAMEPKLLGLAVLGFALTEATGMIAVAISIIILYG